jgi:hypothetical protein
MTPLFKKLNFKNQERVFVLNSPSSFDTELTEMSKCTKIVKDINRVSNIQFVLSFVMTLEQVDESAALIIPKIEGDAIIWFCYPKGTSKKYKCEFNRDSGWKTLGEYNLEAVRAVSIDQDWTALRFRKTEYIKTLTRTEDHAISKEGKERTKKNGRNKPYPPRSLL